MTKFTLNMYEMMEILDPINQTAYDKLQSALEQKICKAMPENDWLSIWEGGDWEIEMTIELKDNATEKA